MKVIEARTTDERRAAFEFRYRIYVEDEGRIQHHADHIRRMIEEPLDEHGRIFIAVDRGNVVGTLRTNLYSEGPFGHYEDLYGIDRLPAHERQASSITTKLMVAHEYRGGTCALRLAKSAFQSAMEAGSEWDFIDSRSHTIPFFQKLGHRIVRTDLWHPEYGLATLMKLNVLDASHLQKVGSPFHSILRSRVSVA